MSAFEERYDLLCEENTALQAENARLREQAEALAGALEKEMVHECSFALWPGNSNVEYCQFCGVLREAER